MTLAKDGQTSSGVTSDPVSRKPGEKDQQVAASQGFRPRRSLRSLKAHSAPATNSSGRRPPGADDRNTRASKSRSRCSRTQHYGAPSLRSVGTNKCRTREPPSTTDERLSPVCSHANAPRLPRSGATAPSLREPSRSIRNPLRGSIDSQYPMNKHPRGRTRTKPLTPGHSGRCALGCAAAAVGSEEHPGPDREDRASRE